MNVTEFALIRLRTGTLEPAFFEVAKRGLDIQNEWHVANYPHLPSTLTERASFILQQVEDPTRLLVTAKWESVQSHWKWIQSEKNISVMTSLGVYTVRESEDDLDMSHVDGDFFGSVPDKSSGESVAMIDSPIIAVERFFVDLQKKDEFDSKLGAVDGTLKVGVIPHPARGGWRIDVEAGKKQEYVLVSGWDTVEKHTEFAGSPLSSPYNQIRDLVAETKTKHYKRII